MHLIFCEAIDKDIRKQDEIENVIASFLTFDATARKALAALDSIIAYLKQYRDQAQQFLDMQDFDIDPDADLESEFERFYSLVIPSSDSTRVIDVTAEDIRLLPDALHAYFIDRRLQPSSLRHHR